MVALILNEKMLFLSFEFLPKLVQNASGFQTGLSDCPSPIGKTKKNSAMCDIKLQSFAVAAALQRQARQLEQELRTGGRALGRVSLRGHERRQGLLVSSRDAASARRPQRRARQF